VGRKDTRPLKGRRRPYRNKYLRGNSQNNHTGTVRAEYNGGQRRVGRNVKGRKGRQRIHYGTVLLCQPRMQLVLLSTPISVQYRSRLPVYPNTTPAHAGNDNTKNRI
jgi:hypothetical protein